MNSFCETGRRSGSRLPGCLQPPGDRGFTLLEVMISVAIIAVTFVTLFGSQSHSISVAADSRFLTTAALLAQERLARLQREDFSLLVSATGDFGEEFPGYSWTLNVRDLEEDEVGIIGTAGRFKLVDLAILFGDGFRYNYSLEFLAAK